MVINIATDSPLPWPLDIIAEHPWLCLGVVLPAGVGLAVLANNERSNGEPADSSTPHASGGADHGAPALRLTTHQEILDVYDSDVASLAVEIFIERRIPLNEDPGDHEGGKGGNDE